MKTFTVFLAAIAIGVLAAIGFAYSGLYDVSASSPHGGFVNWLLSTTSHASVERRASEIDVPNLDDEELALAGVSDFAGMCAGCHGAPGQEPEAMGQGLNPPAPDLAESAAHMTPAELFWVTKNGIKMTGMPAWGATHEDAALWPVVAFMTGLPELDADGYQRLLTSAEGFGHHGVEVDESGHDHGDAEPASGAHEHDQDDHQPAQRGNESTTESDSHDHSAHSHDDPAPNTNDESHEDGHDDHSH